MQEHIKRLFLPHCLAFGFPILIMALIFIFQGVYPFGDETLLTIDLGQQYIDFFAEYKQSVPFHLERFIYSFHKGLGGEMTGLWAYYLMSPLNLIFLLFPLDQIDLAVSLLILLRYGLASFSMSFYLSHQNRSHPLMIVLLSTAYALSGYMVNYQFNLIWMDGVVLLPLIALGVDRLFEVGRADLYIPCLALALISNYYIGYMICLFLTLYALFNWTVHLDRYNNWKQTLAIGTRFALSSIWAAAIASFILIPTFLQLPLSKVADSHFDWNFTLLQNPLDTFAKWTIGSFNFDQMPDGLANIFVTGLVLVLAYRYFFNRQIPWAEKIGAGLVLSVLVLSMNIDALNKIWHGFQNPNWFPYRFSFVFIFFLISLAYRQIIKNQVISLLEFSVGLLLSLGLGLYIYLQDFDFIQLPALALSLGLILLYFSLPLLLMKKEHWLSWTLLALVALELTANAALSINALDYLDRDRFVAANESNHHMAKTIDTYDPFEDDFYRIEKTYQRTKNDSHHAGYKSASHFGSTYEANSHRLFSALGYPAGSGFSAYSNGTLLTDSFFNIRYYVGDHQVNDSPSNTDYYQAGLPMSIIQMKPYLKAYEPVVELPSYTIYENPYAQSLAFKMDPSIQDMTIPPNYPIVLQNQLAHYIDPSQDHPLFMKTIPQLDIHNLNLVHEDDQVVGYPIDEDKKAYIEARLDLSVNHSYYYVLNGWNKWDDFDFYIDGEPLYQYNTFYDDVILNLASQEDKELTIRMEVKNDKIYLSNQGFYAMNLEDFEDINQVMLDQSIPIREYNDRSLSFETDIESDQEMIALSLPYDPSWQIKANGEKVEGVKIMDSLMGIQLPSGHYDIQMTYQTPALKPSLVLSLLASLLYGGRLVRKRWKRDKADQ